MNGTGVLGGVSVCTQAVVPDINRRVVASVGEDRVTKCSITLIKRLFEKQTDALDFCGKIGK